MRKVSLATYTKDPHYPRIVRAVNEILADSDVVAPVDVLIRMGLLLPRHLEDWWMGRVPCLERLIRCNLARLSRILRILRFHAHDRGLEPSPTAYRRWGKGPKQQLWFTKDRVPALEEAYARHFIRRARPSSPAAPSAIAEQ
jgi:hypothetical protein